MSSRTQQGMPGPDGCPAAAVVHLAHPSAPGAFASHEDANGELTVTALPRALRLLNLPTDHDLAVAAAHRPSMNLVDFNELVAELLEDQEATRRAAISLQSALRGFAARARKKAKKKKSKQPSGDLDAVSMTKYVSGLDVSAVSGQLALLELNAPSLQLHRLSGLHTFPALTSLDLSDNALTTLEPLAAIGQLSWLNAASNMLRAGLDFEPPPAILGAPWLGLGLGLGLGIGLGLGLGIGLGLGLGIGLGLGSQCVRVGVRVTFILTPNPNPNPNQVAPACGTPTCAITSSSTPGTAPSPVARPPPTRSPRPPRSEGVPRRCSPASSPPRTRPRAPPPAGSASSP